MKITLDTFRGIAKDCSEDELSQLIKDCGESNLSVIQNEVKDIYSNELKKREKTAQEVEHWEDKYQTQ
jgi:hypothetical protein